MRAAEQKERMGLSAQQIALRQRLAAIFLVMCLIQFSGAWIYPPSGVVVNDSMLVDKFLGVPYQWSIWGLILLATLLHSTAYGFSRLFTILKPLMPFALAGMVAGVFGYDPFASTRMLIMWTLMGLGAAVIGSEISLARAPRILSWTLMLMMLLSVVLALAVPSMGTQLYGMSPVWRGIFLGKNIFGWVAALTMAASFVLMRQGGIKLHIVSVVLALVCLFGSTSKGALVATVVTLAYLYMIQKFSTRLTPGFAIGVIMFMLAIAAVFTFLVLPFVLEAMGRDMTLTGRTEVWSSYFMSMTRTPWLGQGAGAYTTLSPFTAPLASKLAFLGNIVTPHNIFLGVLGDTGLFGLVAFLGMQIYLVMYLPLTRPGTYTSLCAAAGFLMMAHGMVETHEVLVPGMGWFLLVLGRALSLQEQAQQQPATDRATALAAAPHGMLAPARR